MRDIRIYFVGESLAILVDNQPCYSEGNLRAD